MERYATRGLWLGVLALGWCLGGCDSKESAGAASAPAPARDSARAATSASAAPVAASGAATPSASASASAPAEPAGPPRFVSTAGRYSAVFPPGKTIDETREDPKRRAWTITKAEGLMREVQYRDFASPAEANAYVTEFVTTMKSDLEEDREVKAGSVTGRHVRLMVNPTKNLRLFLRMFVVGSRVYKVGAGTNADESTVKDFLDSFALEGAEAAPEPAGSASAAPAASAPPAATNPPSKAAPAPPQPPKPAPPKPAPPKPPSPAGDIY